MTGAVLGKRARCSADTTETQGVLTRAKRRARLVLGNDENDNPFTTRSRTTKKRSHNVFDIDEPTNVTSRSKQSAGSKSVPAKHTVLEDITEISPSRSATRRKSKAQLVDIFNDTDVRTPPTPQTPRHRDALPKKVFVTPKHRISSAAKPLTPRTPRTPSTPSASAHTAVYNNARQLFTRSRHPGALICREREEEELDAFLDECVSDETSGCIYISGPPGTGKSALVREACNRLSCQSNLRMTDVNCVSVQTAKELCINLLSDLAVARELREGEEAGALKELFFEGNGIFLVVLDEIDHFLDIDLDMLYTLFEFSLNPKSNLILVGIANALDFTDRFLPRLKAKGLKPDLLPIMSYTSEQIAKVITAKLLTLMPVGRTDFVPFIHPTAVHFLAKKISAQSGDLRKAFDICRSAIDLIEAETRIKQSSAAATPDCSPSKTPLMENINLSSPPASRSSPKKSIRSYGEANSKAKPNIASLTVENAPRATISHMARVTAKAFGNGSSQRLAVLNLQQKAALCALTALVKKNRMATDPFDSSPSSMSTYNTTNPSTPTKKPYDIHAPTMRSLYAAYSSLCTHDNLLHPLTNTEFRDVVESLENLGLVMYVDRAGKGNSVLFGAESNSNGGKITPSKSASGKGRGRKPAFGFAVAVAEDRKVATVVSEGELNASLVGSGSEILRALLTGRALDY